MMPSSYIGRFRHMNEKLISLIIFFMNGNSTNPLLLILWLAIIYNLFIKLQAL